MFSKCFVAMNLFHAAVFQSPLSTGSLPAVCETPACVTAAEEILTSLNVEADPCEDFHEYACGNFQDDPIDISWMINQLEEPEFSNWAEHQAQLFFASCVDQSETAQGEQDRRAFARVVEQLGGWLFPTSPPGDVDWEKTLETAQNKFKQNIFFSWNVEYNQDNLSKRDIYVFQESGNHSLFAFHDKPDHEIWTHLTTLIEWLHEGSGPVVIKQIKNNIRHALVLNAILRAKPLEGEPRTMDLKELQRSLPFINWKRFFKRGFRRANSEINRNKTSFTVSYLKTLGAISSAITEYSMEPSTRHIIHNYIVLRTLHELSTFQLQHSFMNRENLKLRCLDTTFKLLDVAMNSIYVRRTFPLESRAREDLVDMFEKIRKVIIRRVKDLRWLDEDTKKNTIKRAQEIIFLAGFPDNYLDDSFMNRVYIGLDLSRTGFMANYLKILEYLRNSNTKSLNLPFDRAEFRNIFSAFERNAIYSQELNKVTLAGGMMEEPMYSENYPGYLKYGLLGFLLSHESMHAFFAPKTKGELWMTPNALTQFHNRTKCFSSQYSSYDFLGQKFDGQHLLDQTISDSSGMQAAFDTYQTLVAETGPEPGLPGLDLSNEQLFFIKFAHFLCRKTTTLADFIGLHNAGYPTNELRVNATLSNSEYFSQVFNCRPEKRMNPSTKCRMW